MAYFLDNTEVDPATEDGQNRLARAHQDQTRITCSCTEPRPEMYVACVAGRFILKRMPGSGAQHAPGCDSFLPPEDLSGLAQIHGSAVKEDLETGTTILKLDFPLSMGSNRPAPPPPSGKRPTEAKPKPQKLGLSSLLQYLWHESDLVKWTPAMDGKRWWGPVQSNLLAAASGKNAKSQNLRDILYIPQPWKKDKQRDNAAQRNQIFHRLRAPAKGTAPLGILIAEYKSHETTRMGARFLFKHAPDCTFFAEADLVKRFEKVFSHQLMLAEALGDAHVMVIATFSIAKAGYPVMREIGMLLTTANWIPFETMRDYMLIDALTEKGRRFQKSQRFNLAHDTPIASIILTDLTSPLSMFAADISADAVEIAALREVAAEGTYPAWLWIEDEPLPEIPAKGSEPISHVVQERNDA